MVQIVAGKKGRGKTKYLIEMANEAVKSTDGKMIYLDKSQRNMHELDNRIRLINVLEYPIKSGNDLVCFICGLLSADHDIESIYVDSLLLLSKVNLDDDITPTLKEFDKISETFEIDFVLSVSRDIEEVPDIYKEKIIISL